MKIKTDLNKGYLLGVLALTLFIPALSILAEKIINTESSINIDLVGKWFIFWAVGLCLFTAGIRQTTNPSFTVETIFHISNPRMEGYRQRVRIRQYVFWSGWDFIFIFPFIANSQRLWKWAILWNCGI